MTLEEAIDLAAMDGVTIKKGIAVPDKDGNIAEPPVHITIHESYPLERPVKFDDYDTFIKYMENKVEVEASCDAEEESTIVDKHKHINTSSNVEDDDDEIDTDDWLGPNADETWEDLYDKD